jgi:hypothetical protein
VTGQDDALVDPVDVARERSASDPERLQSGVIVERCVPSGKRFVAAAIGPEQAAQGENASVWGAQFVNHGITADCPQRTARVIEANRAAAEAANRWHGNGRLDHCRIEAGND